MSNTQTLQFVTLRHYLRTARPTVAEDIMVAAFDRDEPGALQLVEMAGQLRGNKRTRRTVEAVRQERRKRRRGRWYAVLAKGVLALFRTMRRLSVPAQAPVATTGPELARRERRALAPTGAVVTQVASLRARVDEATVALWQALPGRQVVLWMDNDYRERWGTDPARVGLSLNITAMSVLFLDMDVPAGQMATRAVRVAQFPGHLTTSRLVGRVRDVAVFLAGAVDAIHHNVRFVNGRRLTADTVRVPLDVVRPAVRSLPWKPCLLSEYQVSGNEDLLSLLEMACGLQLRCRVQMPLLLDENIHYRVLRLMHSVSHREVDVGDWLSHVPLLYGIWHPYKHCLGVVYRAFLPIIAPLEGAGTLRPGDKVVPGRKVLYMEKVFATLLVVGSLVRERLEAQLRTVRAAPQAPSSSPPSQPPPSDRASSSRDTPGLPADTELVVLEGLHTLLYFYCPLLFQMGWKVRQCTWEGRPGQAVRGDVAKQVLQQAMLVMCHLSDDWHCREEYPRTIAMALLTWQPWHSALPSGILPRLR